MKTFGNIIWILFGGFLAWLSWILVGIILCITIIGIPFGKQCFKLAHLYLVPFGTTVNTHFERHPIMNVLWIILFGWELALSNLITSLIFYITIIGIPFGKQWMKLAVLSFIPFGADIR